MDSTSGRDVDTSQHPHARRERRGRRARLGHRSIVVAVVGALVTALLGSALTLALGGVDLSSVCGSGGEVLRLRDGAATCMHADQAPPGVDVTDHVSTAALRTRPGAGPAAYRAAEDLGVPTAVASAASTPDVTCEGDGTSGYRTQVMYVVEAGTANRYAAVLPQFRTWAAGVDDVVNRSAALTGGVRHVRYVTTAGADGTCVADVLNVTVPTGSMASFGATINAVQALGYADPTRKYLMYTDASRLCGVATLYPYDRADQGNPNNGSYAQYARVDSGCWGLGNRSGQHSVEAHELVHALGAVLRSAPHSTGPGHCWDESDTMCYADGDPHPMVAVCPADREYLLDCNSDDYFSTYPDPGSYLASHWNAAGSRFLIGGGDGSGGGSAGTPTVLGARLAVNNPAVPGLATQATVTPVLPPGRTLASVAWSTPRSDCVFGTPTAVQSTVTCSAVTTAATTVKATLTDSTGATKTVTSPLTFATGGSPRPVSVTLAISGRSTADVASTSMCLGAPTPVTAALADTQTGLPIKGLTATFAKQADTQAVASAAGAVLSDVTGTAGVSQSAVRPTVFSAATVANPTYAAATRVSMAATVERCAPVLTAAASSLDVWLGDTVRVTGTLTRTVGDRDDVPVANVTLPVTSTSSVTSATGRVTSRVLTLGMARTAADGSFSMAATPTTAGRLAVALPGSPSYAAASADLGDLVVRATTSSLTGAVARADVGYGAPVVVTGKLERVTSTTAGAAGAVVIASVQAPGARSGTPIGSTRTLADGTFRLVVPLRLSGALSVAYQGTSTLPGSRSDLGAVTAGTWGTALTAAASSSSVAAGTPVTVSGTLTRSYGDTSEPAPSVLVRILARADGATTDTVTLVSTGAAGTFKALVRPRVTTTYSVRVIGVPKYADATAGFTVTVG